METTHHRIEEKAFVKNYRILWRKTGGSRQIVSGEGSFARGGSVLLAKMDLDGVWELHPVAEFSSLWWSEDVPNEGWVEQELPGQWQELEAFSRYAGKMVYRRNFRFTPEPDRIY